MSQLSPSVLVLLAALNEEEGLGLTIGEFKKFLSISRLLVVDGKSVDKTVFIAKSLGVDVVQQDGQGKGDAIKCGLKNVDGNYDYVVFSDADYTYPAEFVPQMIEILESDPKVGMVCGNRFNSNFQVAAMRTLFYFGNRFLAFTHNLLNGVILVDPLTGLRVVRWKIIKNWKPKAVGFDIEVELNHHVERQGFGIAEIEIPYRKRFGEKKLRLRDGIAILKRIITEASL